MQPQTSSESQFGPIDSSDPEAKLHAHTTVRGAYNLPDVSSDSSTRCVSKTHWSGKTCRRTDDRRRSIYDAMRHNFVRLPTTTVTRSAQRRTKLPIPSKSLRGMHPSPEICAVSRRPKSIASRVRPPHIHTGWKNTGRKFRGSTCPSTKLPRPLSARCSTSPSRPI